MYQYTTVEKTFISFIITMLHLHWKWNKYCNEVSLTEHSMSAANLNVLDLIARNAKRSIAVLIVNVQFTYACSGYRTPLITESYILTNLFSMSVLTHFSYHWLDHLVTTNKICILITAQYEPFAAEIDQTNRSTAENSRKKLWLST